MGPAALLLLAAQCAPGVAPATLVSLVDAESAGEPAAIGVNGPNHRAMHLRSRPQALATAEALQRRGANFDIGLAQINVRNLASLQLSLGEALDPCRNLAAGAQILRENYQRSLGEGRSAQAALRAALSRYNTGDPARGLANGYVARVYRAAAQIVPQIDLSEPGGRSEPPLPSPVRLHGARPSPHERVTASASTASDLNVFVQTNPALLVFPSSPSAERAAPPPITPAPSDGDPS